MDKRIHLIVKGRVQGVFFRDYTLTKASELGLTGTVCNRNDGSVEVFAQGDELMLKELEKWCWQGSPMSQVTKVMMTELNETCSYSGFRVVYK